MTKTVGEVKEVSKPAGWSLRHRHLAFTGDEAKQGELTAWIRVRTYGKSIIDTKK